MKDRNLAHYPGGDLVEQGFADLVAGKLSEAALLVLVARPRLESLGIGVPERNDIEQPVEHRLYESIESRLGRGAHSAYNALIRRIVSFANSYRSENQTSKSNGNSG